MAEPVAGLEALPTPALLVFAEAVEHNVARAIELVGGLDAWRPHVKTIKSRAVMELLVAQGVTRFKCATTLELLELCAAGASDVLLAYHPVGPAVDRIAAIAEEHSGTRVSVLAEEPALVERWADTPVDVFLDVDVGLQRTGVPIEHGDRLLAVAEAAAGAGVAMRGLHLYAGDLQISDARDRARALHATYDLVADLAAELLAAHVPLEELATAGTPALRGSLDYRGFDALPLTHRSGAGTIVFGDRRSLREPGIAEGFQPAAVVLSRVIGCGVPGRVTCDAGHKAVSADAGVPTCEVVGHPTWTPLSPSEEHLPIAIGERPRPRYGELLRLLPTHVCPTTNLHDHVVIVRGGEVASIEPLAARGHELAERGVRTLAPSAVARV